MPLLEFKCKAGHVTERLIQAHVDQTIGIRCPKCGKFAERIFSRTAPPILKEGVGGFYRPSKADQKE